MCTVCCSSPFSDLAEARKCLSDQLYSHEQVLSAVGLQLRLTSFRMYANDAFAALNSNKMAHRDRHIRQFMDTLAEFHTDIQHGNFELPAHVTEALRPALSGMEAAIAAISPNGTSFTCREIAS